MQKQSRKRLVTVIRWVLIAAMLGLVVYAVIRYAPYLKAFLNDPSTITGLTDWMESFGVLGIAVLLAIQVVQVFFAVIPSDPIEMAAGMCYGSLWGFLLCSAGVLLGTMGVFFLVRRYGEPFVEAFIEEKHIKKFRFLQNSRRLELIAFLLYFIPGLPKDVFTYLAALTPIKPSRFFVISSIGRIPSILVTVIGGENLAKGNVVSTVVLFAIFGGIGTIGMIVYRIVTGRIDKKHPPEQTGDED